MLLRPIGGADDYAVIEAGEPIGRIRRAGERTSEVWMWNVTIPAPGATGGTADDLDAAKDAFRQSWLALKAAIGPQGLGEALATAQAARDRSK